jgi:fructose-1,6-bisphosphatase/inositol monophosphatase family enzyme
MRAPTPETVARLIVEIAAEEVVPRFRNLAKGEVLEKGRGDIVTRADHETERRLTRALKELVPGSDVVGEEAAHDDPSIVDKIAQGGVVWVVDPLDGTSNFARGSERFAVMVGLVVEGEAVAGWIHIPTRGVTAIAERGQGAYIAARKLAVARERPLSAMRASVHTGFLPKEIKSQVNDAIRRLGSNEQIYCAGQVYVGLAEGELDGALFWRLKPWDHVMGMLILEEAGGFGALYDGTVYRPTLKDRYCLLAASSRTTWQALRDLLLPPDSPLALGLARLERGEGPPAH